MAIKEDNQLRTDIANSFVSGVVKWSGQRLEERLVDMVDSKINNNDLPLNMTAPSTGQVLQWDGTAWVNGSASGLNVTDNIEAP